MAGDEGTYAVYVRPRCVDDAEDVCKKLCSLFDLNYEKLLNKVNSNKSEVLVVSQISKEKINELQEYNLSGVYFSIDNSRYYPFDSALCQTLGFISSDGSGQSGIEKYYNDYLQGTDGEILYESDLTGTNLSKYPTYVPAVDGLNVKLTIDYEIQLICENQMQIAMQEYTPKSAKVIVLEPSTGRILAMAQKPSYNLNELPRDDVESLMSLGRNGFITDSYEPGSTFKVITASANIEEYYLGNSKAFSPEYVFPSSRYRYVLGRKIKCWSTHNNGKHANENLALALNNSCNPIFVDIGLSLGKSKMYEYINKFNFGKATGIDFQGEAIGMLIPESAVTEGDIARIAFGQTIAVTPIQLACAVASAVNSGIYYKPYLLEEIYDSNGNAVIRNYPVAVDRVISENSSKYIASCLESVVADGSGKQAFIDGYRVGGKTGTAQKYENGIISVGKYIMSFVGFFPATEPKYLALVIIDEPVGGQYGSTVAAPICKNIFNEIIKAKNIKTVI
ncbi:MAG: stage V sporulation protein D [Clostridia bacterium]|nr:stage V sporulation protein D [Clostridia bacterium]